MNERHLSKRLQAVAAFVPDGSRLADIGSDHAYLPVYLVKTGQVTRAVAGEVRQGPFASGQKEIKDSGCGDRISMRLGNGLEVIEPDDKITVITICGMGGRLIADILDQGLKLGKLANHPRLILQPNVQEALVRSWLDDHGYRITEENMVKERGHIYEIIAADYQGRSPVLSEGERFFGLYTEVAAPDIFREKWETEAAKLENILSQLDPAENPDVCKELGKRKKWIEARLGGKTQDE